MRHKAETIADSLAGTCSSIGEALELEGFDLGLESDISFLSKLDSYVFSCASCGWWYYNSELGNVRDGELVCHECFETEET